MYTPPSNATIFSYVHKAQSSLATCTPIPINGWWIMIYMYPLEYSPFFLLLLFFYMMAAIAFSMSLHCYCLPFIRFVIQYVIKSLFLPRPFWGLLCALLSGSPTRYVPLAEFCLFFFLVYPSQCRSIRTYLWFACHHLHQQGFCPFFSQYVRVPLEVMVVRACRLCNPCNGIIVTSTVHRGRGSSLTQSWICRLLGVR